LSTILAMGGGGFTMEPVGGALDELVLGLAKAPVPRICFLPTASGDPGEQIARFHAAFADRPCVPVHLSLFRLGANPVDLRAHLLAQDVVYVGGGSMRNMLAIWRAHGLDVILRECWERGTVLAGLSAGAMCWFGGGITTSSGRPAPVEGLGILPGSLSVHLDGEPERRRPYLDAVASGALPGGWAADDGVGLLFEDRELVRVVGSRPGLHCIRVDRDGDRARVTEVEVEALRAHPHGYRLLDADVRELRSLRYRASAGR
jgi:dipeptidase E